MAKEESGSTRGLSTSLIAAAGMMVLLWYAQAITVAGALVVWTTFAAGVFVLRARGRAAVERAEQSGLERERAAAARIRSAADTTASAAAALDALPDAIIELDADQKVIRANAAARDGFDAVPGAEVAAVIRDPDVLANVEDALAGRETTIVAHTRPGPVELHFEVVVLKPRLAPGARASAILVFHDVTALRRANDFRVDFVANVSHELRTPLTAIMGFIETLQGPARDDAEARVRFLAIMHDEARRMSRLVSDLLSLSRIEAVEHAVPTERVALGAVLGRVIDGAAATARPKNMRIALSVDADLPLVLGDADQLQQVFQNLIENAIKYGRADSEVRISANRETDDRVAVAVIDSGEGIAREHLPRLTERFYRVDPGRSRRMGGTGLGLAIVKHIVNRHRATLTIESEPGRGSVFTVTFQGVGAAAGQD